MKTRIFFSCLFLLYATFLAACGAQSPPPTPETLSPTETKIIVPTSLPSPTPEPTIPPTSTPVPLPTLPPADAAIIFSEKTCSYEGPEKIPVTVPFLVNWIVESKDYENYGLFVFMVEEGKTKEDLRNMLKGETAEQWVIQAGSFETTPSSSKQITVISSSGEWFGDLYFTCWDSSKMFMILGPFAVVEAKQ
jgi:hypothetical protein